MGRLVGIFCALVGLSLVLGAVEILLPARRAQRRIRPGLRADLAWWFFTPLLAKPVTQLGILVALLPLVAVLGLPMDESLKEGHGPLAALPGVVQFGAILLIGDLVGYGVHRATHRGWLWPMHAVHHSSEELDWLSSVRVHPVNEIVNKLPRVLLLVPMGFDLTLLAAYVPFTTLYALFLHANTSVHYPRPLRWLLASPRYHRWHHANQERACNFAGLFPIWDIVFGTYRLPPHDPPAFGVEDPVPTGFFGQLLWPFRPSSYRPPPPVTRREAV